MTDHSQDDLLQRIAELDDDVPPMPEDFHQAWMQKVEEDMTKPTRKPLRPTVVRMLSAAAALVFVVGGALFTQAGMEKQLTQSTLQKNSSVEESYDYSNDGAAFYSLGAARMAGGGEAVEDSAAQGQKIIRTARLSITTARYEEALASLEAACESCGGWIASSSQNAYNNARTAEMSLRIPAESLDAFLDGASGAGRVVQRSETAQDVTAEYQDLQAQLDTQLALMERLQALMTSAADLSDLLALESQLADTQYTIDSLRGRLQSTDRQVSYATVSITLREEAPAVTDEELTLSQRLSLALSGGLEAFGIFLEGLCVFLVAALPFAGVVAVVWGAVALLRRIVKGRKS